MKTIALSRLSIVIYTVIAIYSMIAGTVSLLWGYLTGVYHRADLASVPWLRWVARDK
jgi:hypothetical protein